MKALNSSTFTAEFVRMPGQVILRVSGRLANVTGRPSWSACLESLPTVDVGLDLSAVSLMDASGLGLLADFVRGARAQGRRVSVVSASRRVRRLLELTHLDTELARGPRIAA